MDVIPLGVLFIGTLIILFAAIELGYRIGNLLPEHERKLKEKTTSVNSGAVLGLLGFILVFTFSIVYSRYDSRKELIREEANMIRTAWMRSDFLPEQDRAEAVKLFSRYVDLRIESAEANDVDELTVHINQSNQIQNQIWDMAVVNARMDMNSDVAALYLESLNEMINQQALRIAVGVQARIPVAIWVLLYLLIFLGMFGIGYESSIAGSTKRSWLTPIMMLAFALMITIIASLDRPKTELIRVSQQPIVDLKSYMEQIK